MRRALGFTLGGLIIMFPVITKKSSILLQYCISTSEISVGQDVNQFALFLK
jgi:hypothetical protein